MIWTWSVQQVTKLVEMPWQDWPVLKVVLLIVLVAAVIWALYRVFWELWLGAERVLSAFAGLLVIFVQTLPRVLLAGVIALGGLWVMNHLDNSMMRVPISLQIWPQQPQQPQHD
jgi:peptidoglycan biosynthesis protein MviN/MurJ (putative lipid II flippase)